MNDRIRLVAALVPLVLSCPPVAYGQQPATQAGWDTPAVRELVLRAIERRAQPLADPSLRHYSARADGTIQFLLEPEAGTPPVPLRMDQVSLDMYWQAPNRSRQSIRALRKQDLLPIRQFHYYLDRLTIVQEGFGDRISIGEERDVRDVPHPLSPGADELYSYRMADTVTLHVPGLAAPIRVVRVEVRPRDVSRPRFVGDVFVDATAATLVRMRFTFTPASYVDPRTDRISVALEHGLWEGRYWLPHRQELEVRRQAPEIDLGVSTVIRAQMDVRDYDFETPIVIPAGMPRVTYPVGQGDTTRFERSLADVIADEGLRTTTVTDLAADLGVGIAQMPALLRLRPREPGGLPRVRIFVPSVSSVLRANRAEGAVVGGGLSARPTPGTLLTLQAGFATGPEHVTARAGFATALGEGTSLHLGARLNDVQEIEPAPPAGQLINSIATVVAGSDWLNPYHVDGGALVLRTSRRPRLGISIGAEVERHRSAAQAWRDSPWTSRSLPPVLPVAEGTRARAVATLRWTGSGTASTLTASATSSAGAWRGEPFATQAAHVAWQAPTFGTSFDLRLQLRGAASFGALPPQHLYLPAGTRLLPGHAPTTLAGSRYIAGSIEGMHHLQGLPFTAHASVQAAAVAGRGNVPDDWMVDRGVRMRSSATIGIGVLRDLLRVDYSHGFGGSGEWRARVSPVIAPLL
jgi:hypothetical protein